MHSTQRQQHIHWQPCTHTQSIQPCTHIQSIQTCTHVSADTLHIAARCTQTYTHTTHACIGIHKANTKQNTETHARNHTGTQRTQTRKRKHTACMHTDRHTHARSLEISTHIILWDILLPFCMRNGDGNLRFFYLYLLWLLLLSCCFVAAAVVAAAVAAAAAGGTAAGMLLYINEIWLQRRRLRDWIVAMDNRFLITSGGESSIRKTRNFCWILRGFAVFFHTFYHFIL